jgi:hypothetical protein
MSTISGKRTLHRLIYASRQEIEPADLDDVVGQIIRSAISNNRAVSVTGLLLIHEGWFLQALEGPTAAVLTIYGAISNDPRHSGLKVLQAGPADTRAFADWNMCARRMTPADDAILDTLAMRAVFEPAKLSGPAALRLLQAVRGIQNRTELEALR